MSNYIKTAVANERRVELHEKLALTGAEVTVNRLPAGECVPFVHSHKQNEEIYGIISGKGKFVIDGENVELNAGDWLKILPAAKRQIFAAPDSPLMYICVQAKQNSIEGFNETDGIVY